VRNYFETLSLVHLPVILLENKVYLPKQEATEPCLLHERAKAPPWKIGWFGAIRCKKSLAILNELARLGDGLIEVIIRGRIAQDQLPDFEQRVHDTKWIHFEGVYQNPNDLAKIYNDVHFTWAIDMFEEGQNSAWLLPNRLYEGGLYNAVPLALENVEIGHFLNRLQLGVVFKDVQAQTLLSFFKNLTIEEYQKKENQAMQAPRQTWLADQEDCVTLIERLKEIKNG
jgi:hypothetical protein